ncbi:hypothetical protein [Salipaludibacillus daqingensis]|uniref:baeRF3 domain-containing protein n=1 Tax=Salipaludibacillus daqingensis TaxID=3041001 RepID=UPI00247380D4|nr:hypothetical protein [Salipaludibacillus daqingensis]
MYEIVKEFPHEIMFEKAAPFISLYQPTHKFSPGNKQDPIVFKRLTRKIESSLKDSYPNSNFKSLMKPFNQIAKDKEFWRTISEGLAIYATESTCVVYKIERPVKELAIVADRLHISPLIRVFQSADQYQLLGINRNTFSLFEGNRYGFREIPLPNDIPRTKEDVLGDQRTEPYLAKGSFGDPGGKYFGHGGKKDELDKDTEKFFRFVDRFVLENYSKSSQLPLILVALKEYHGPFKKVSNNSFLMNEGIKGAYDSMEKDKLTEKVWEIIEPIYLDKTKKLIDAFETAKAKGSGSYHLEEVVQAAIENRLVSILIEDDRIIPGTIDDTSGEIKNGTSNDDDYSDVLGDLTEIAFKKKANLVVLPKNRMPSETGVAAVFR